ncbi:MAG: thiaminase II, partial [Chloroflexi bacterium]|nr:thiaminase II [Chloroflexota bacterium]
MPSFSEQLRNEAEPIWRRIFDHPFLKEIKDGTLPLDTFRYYLAQDYLYLEGFGRTVAMALA